MINEIRPTNITLNRQEGMLDIEWSTGETCHYPLGHIREACPCVECRGGHHNMGMSNAPQSLDLLVLKPARSYGVDEAQIVGNYALQITWEDGHNSGIYTWEYLYHLCPEKLEKDI